MQNYNSKLKIKEKVLSFELWFFAFSFNFLVVYRDCRAPNAILDTQYAIRITIH